MFGNSSEISHDLRAVADGRLHRRAESGADSNQSNETPDKQDSPSPSAWLKPGLTEEMEKSR